MRISEKENELYKSVYETSAFYAARMRRRKVCVQKESDRNSKRLSEIAREAETKKKQP